jgi:hypothetical protein
MQCGGMELEGVGERLIRGAPARSTVRDAPLSRRREHVREGAVKLGALFEAQRNAMLFR